MAKRVLTGCRDCRKCSISGIGKAGRNAGRGMAALMTGGMSEMGMAMTKDCGACGHALSLHEDTKVKGWAQEMRDPTPASAPVPTVEPRRGSLRFDADADTVWTTVLDGREARHVKKRDDALKQAQLDLPSGKFMDEPMVGNVSVVALSETQSRLDFEVRPSKMSAWGASGNASAVLKLNARIATEADKLVTCVAALPKSAEPTPAIQAAGAIAAPSPARSDSDAPGTDDLVTKIERLAALHSQGALSDDEFSAAKARLLA